MASERINVSKNTLTQMIRRFRHISLHLYVLEYSQLVPLVFHIPVYQQNHDLDTSP